MMVKILVLTEADNGDIIIAADVIWVHAARSVARVICASPPLASTGLPGATEAKGEEPQEARARDCPSLRVSYSHALNEQWDTPRHATPRVARVVSGRAQLFT